MKEINDNRQMTGLDIFINFAMGLLAISFGIMLALAIYKYINMGG